MRVLIIAEYLKMRNQQNCFLVGFAVFMPLITSLMAYFKPSGFIGESNPWDEFFIAKFSFMCVMLYSFYMILATEGNLNLEHNSSSWEKILLFPNSRVKFFLSKFVFLCYNP